MKNIVLTFDYELFGDGTGDVFKHIIEPTNKILRNCDAYGIKVTIFFEAIEFIKLKEEWNKGNKMGYSSNPILAIENQIRDAANNGHDIQLHVHPQWVKAKFSNGKWDLDKSNWRLGDFYTSDAYRIKDLLNEGINELKSIILPVMPEYNCIALRAGYYNIMPSQEIYSAMIELGLKIDSSIYPGGFEYGSFQKYDYRKVPVHLDYWWADETDIREASQINRNILEIPVFALPVSPLKKLLTISKLKSLIFQRNTSISSGAKEKLGYKTFSEKIKFILKKEACPWDVCMFSKSLNRQFFKLIEKKHFATRNSFVLIGHPKNLQNEKMFCSFLKIAYNRKINYKFKSLIEQYAEIL